MNPPIIAQRELYQKIRKATRAVGIKYAVIREWDRYLMSSWFTDGCVREKQYIHSTIRQNRAKDIGYVIRERQSGRYTIQSLLINAFVFSDDAYKRFQKALEKEGLKPTAYSHLGIIFPTKLEIKAWENKTPLYR